MNTTTPALIAHDDNGVRIDADLAHLRSIGLLPGWLVPTRRITEWRREGMDFSLIRLAPSMGSWRLLVRGPHRALAELVADDVLRRVSRD